MKKKLLRYAAVTTAAVTLAAAAVGCGQQAAESTGSAAVSEAAEEAPAEEAASEEETPVEETASEEEAPAEEAPAKETASEEEAPAEEAAPAEEQAEEAAPAPAAEITCDISDIDYANIEFDYTDQIVSEMEAVLLVPEAAQIGLTAEDAGGASGSVLVASIDEANTTDYYMNAYVAGNAINFAGDIVSAESSISGELTVENGSLSYIPAVIDATAMTDEVITFETESGDSVNVHMIPECFPALEITGEGVAEENAGVYTFALDKFMIRVNTEGEIIYYRNMGQVGEELMVEGFAPQTLADKQYYSMFVELHPEFRNALGGFSSGFYLVMNENYQDIDRVVLAANDEENHVHGEGYLDQHEFRIMDENHYMLLSYTPLLIDNLPASLQGIDGESKAYVWAGIIQEVQDGQVVSEINTADYPLLYESAVEKIDYAGSTDQGVNVVVNQNEVFSIADGIQDYTHVNSVDYTLDPDGTADKILVSMRDQSAVFQFDMDTGALEWILGGKASTLTGYEEYAEPRTDDNGAGFQALTFGQHYARYTNKAEDGTVSGNVEFSVFDNHTGMAPFILAVQPATTTRVFKAAVDEAAGTAEISDVIDGAMLNEKTEKYHIASHCGSVQYDSDSSVVIGWGLHGVIDNLGPFVPEGTIGDIGYDDLRIGSRPVVTEYDPVNDSVTFELSGTRNPNEMNTEAFFSYRTYKTKQ